METKTILREDRGSKPGNAHWETLAETLGLPIEELRAMDDAEIDALIEKHNQRPLTHTMVIGRHIPRGNPLLALGRFIDHSSILARFEKLFG